MSHVLTFIIGIYIGTEIQAWWYRKGCTSFIKFYKEKGKKW